MECRFKTIIIVDLVLSFSAKLNIKKIITYFPIFAHTFGIKKCMTVSLFLSSYFCLKKNM